MCGHFDLPCLEVRTLRYKRGKIQSSSMCMCVCVCVRVGGWGWKKEWLSNLGNLIQNATHERSERNRSKRQNWVEIIHGISIQTTFITLIKCVKIEKNLQHKPLPLIQKLPPSLVSVLRESWVISGVIWSINCFGGQPLSIYVKLSDDVAVVPKANGKERNDGH